MRIVIVTGIYPPDIGGPAYYAQQVARELHARGHGVQVVTYGEQSEHREDNGIPVSVVSRRHLPGLRHWAYYRQCRLLVRAGVDVVFMLDTFSAAVPAVAAFRGASVRRCLRTGGDFIWERAVEQGATSAPLLAFYQETLPFSLRIKKWLTQRMLARVHRVIFSTRMQAQLYEKHYGVPHDRIQILMNPVDTAHAVVVQSSREPGQEILFAGRFLRLKNLDRLIAAFEQIAPIYPQARLRLIGEGPEGAVLADRMKRSPFAARMRMQPALPKQALLHELAAARMFVLPSLSEVSPNLLLDCVHVGTPFVTTSEIGLADMVCPHAVCVDPLSSDAIAAGMRVLMDDGVWRRYREQLRGIDVQQDWKNFTDVLEQTFTSLCAS